MPASGRPWARESAAFKAECERRSSPCWICHNSRGPIQYDAEPRTPLSFSIDHVTPTSLGGDSLRRANLKPAHYQLLQ